MYELSKVVPARRKALRIRQAKRDFMEMSKRYREIRGASRNPLDTCVWCKHKFKNGEMMGLLIMEKGRNKVVCNDCYDSMKLIKE